jgi:hypothetical protein
MSSSSGFKVILYIILCSRAINVNVNIFSLHGFIGSKSTLKRRDVPKDCDIARKQIPVYIGWVLNVYLSISNELKQMFRELVARK